jgi:hypothetical protein
MWSFHAADHAEVARRQLDRRLAYLEGRLGRRARTLLGDEDRRFRALPLQLQRQRQTGKPAAEDGDVVALGQLLSISDHFLSSRAAGRRGRILGAT